MVYGVQFVHRNNGYNFGQLISKRYIRAENGPRKGNQNDQGVKVCSLRGKIKTYKAWGLTAQS